MANDIGVGVFYSAQQLLALAAEQSFTHESLVASFDTFVVAGVDEVLEISQRCNWLIVDSAGRVHVTAEGATVCAAAEAIAGLRVQLRDYIRRYSPAWAKSLRHGRYEAARLMPSGITQAFKEAELLSGTSHEIVSWWDQLALAARAERQNTSLEVGRRAERLSFEHEFHRTGTQPQWQALESNFAGFDVLSRESGKPLRIEVKGSEQRTKQAFCHVTRHEWITACRAPDEYVFDLWLLHQEPRLSRIPARQMALHIPSDSGEGEWESVKIPFAPFAGPI